MLLLSVAFMYKASKQTSAKKKYLYCFLAFLPFLLVSGFRYGLGTDYIRRYVYDFNRTLGGYRVPNIEIGFHILMKATMLVTDEPYLMFFITSLLTNGFVFFVVSAKSKDKMLSICIYFLLGFFFDSLNIMRQYLAMSVVVMGFYFLLKNQKLWYVVSVLLAATFHSSALVMLALILFDYRVLCSPKWFIPCLVAVLAINTRMLDLMAFLLKSTRFAVYFDGKFYQGEVSFLFIGENLAFYLLMVWLQSAGYVSKNKISNLYLNTQAMALLCMCLGACHMLFIRVAFYFSIFQILSVPYYLSHCRKTYRLSIGNKQVYLDILKILVLCAMFVAFYRTNIQTNVNEVVPYRTIFTRNWLIY